MNYFDRKRKEVCESCGCTPHAPRRRCNDCNKLVCVSACWNRKLQLCSSCAAPILTKLRGSPPLRSPIKSAGPINQTKGEGQTGPSALTGLCLMPAQFATCFKCGQRQHHLSGLSFAPCAKCGGMGWFDRSPYR